MVCICHDGCEQYKEYYFGFIASLFAFSPTVPIMVGSIAVIKNAFLVHTFFFGKGGWVHGQGSAGVREEGEWLGNFGRVQASVASNT
jgi:hypothetical protein